MDPVHIHLLLNHAPIIGFYVGVALLVYALFRKSEEVMVTAFIALALSALAAVPVYLTGEPAEDAVERLPGVAKALIEEHEDAGKLSIIAAIGSGILALASLIFSRRGQLGKALIWVTLAVSLVSAVLMARTGNLGGQIRHSEIRTDRSSQQTTQGEKPSADKNTRKGDDHDD